MRNYRWDLFICHAWEEKETLVRPLAENLSALGLKVWYDDFALGVGNSLLRSVDSGLANSRFGLVIISTSFFKKEFPQHELRGLATRQLHEGREVILPVWHGVSKDDVLAFSPPLADLIAIRTADTPAEDIGLEILLKVRPDIYEQHERSDLLKLYKSKPLHELREEMMQLQERLSQYQCPYCGALMEEHSVFDDGEHAMSSRVFACGLRTDSGLVEEMCPNVTDVPKFGEFQTTALVGPRLGCLKLERPGTSVNLTHCSSAAQRLRRRQYRSYTRHTCGSSSIKSGAISPGK